MADKLYADRKKSRYLLVEVGYWIKKEKKIVIDLKVFTKPNKYLKNNWRTSTVFCIIVGVL